MSDAVLKEEEPTSDIDPKRYVDAQMAALAANPAKFFEKVKIQPESPWNRGLLNLSRDKKSLLEKKFPGSSVRQHEGVDLVFDKNGDLVAFTNDSTKTDLGDIADWAGTLTRIAAEGVGAAGGAILGAGAGAPTGPGAIATAAKGAMLGAGGGAVMAESTAQAGLGVFSPKDIALSAAEGAAGEGIGTGVVKLAGKVSRAVRNARSLSPKEVKIEKAYRGLLDKVGPKLPMEQVSERVAKVAQADVAETVLQRSAETDPLYEKAGKSIALAKLPKFSKRVDELFKMQLGKPIGLRTIADRLYSGGKMTVGDARDMLTGLSEGAKTPSLISGITQFDNKHFAKELRGLLLDDLDDVAKSQTRASGDAATLLEANSKYRKFSDVIDEKKKAVLFDVFEKTFGKDADVLAELKTSQKTDRTALKILLDDHTTLDTTGKVMRTLEKTHPDLADHAKRSLLDELSDPAKIKLITDKKVDRAKAILGDTSLTDDFVTLVGLAKKAAKKDAAPFLEGGAKTGARVAAAVSGAGWLVALEAFLGSVTKAGVLKQAFTERKTAAAVHRAMSHAKKGEYSLAKRTWDKAVVPALEQTAKRGSTEAVQRVNTDE